MSAVSATETPPGAGARMELVWQPAGGPALLAVEPDDALVRAHAATLAGWYNARENASMMGGQTTLTADDVVDFWRELRSGGGRGFFSFADGALVGDMDLRTVDLARRTAEFAILVGARETKGRGLGGKFACMIHVFAFRELGLARTYGQPKRENERVQRLEARLGYERDDSPEAWAYADPGDDVLPASCSREAFAARCEDAWREVVARLVR